MTITSPSWRPTLTARKVETIEMPYDYIKRKYDIFYNYDLEEGPRQTGY